MGNLSWTPHNSNLEKDNSHTKTTPVLAQRWAVWSILSKNYKNLLSILLSISPMNRQSSIHKGSFLKKILSGIDSHAAEHDNKAIEILKALLSSKPALTFYNVNNIEPLTIQAYPS